jgi:hypothetical protein
VGGTDADLIEDTRQQLAGGDKHAAKHRWWSAHGIVVVRQKLEFGDYMAADGHSNISVDTKRNLDEVAGNVGRDHDRVAREMDRARDAGFRLVFLVEQRGYRDVWDVARWLPQPCRRCQARRMGECDPRASMRCANHKRKPMQGAQVARTMDAMARDHGCIWLFSDPASSGRIICELLGVCYRR